MVTAAVERFYPALQGDEQFVSRICGFHILSIEINQLSNGKDLLIHFSRLFRRLFFGSGAKV